METSHSLVPPIIRPRVAFSHTDAAPGTLTLGLACEPQPAAAESVSDAGERIHVGVTVFRHRHGRLRTNGPHRPPVCVFIVHTQRAGFPAPDTTILLM